MSIVPSIILGAALLIVQVNVLRMLRRLVKATDNNNQIEWRRLEVAIAANAATGLRIEAATGDARVLAEGVAVDLERGHDRANSAGMLPGEAADAQAKTSETA